MKKREFPMIPLAVAAPEWAPRFARVVCDAPSISLPPTVPPPSGQWTVTPGAEAKSHWREGAIN